MIFVSGQSTCQECHTTLVKKFDEFGTIGDLNKALDDRETHSG